MLCRIATILAFFTCKKAQAKTSEDVPALIELHNDSDPGQSHFIQETADIIKSSDSTLKTSILPRAQPILEISSFPEETGTEVVNVTSMTNEADQKLFANIMTKTSRSSGKSIGSKNELSVNGDAANEIIEVLSVSGSSANKSVTDANNEDVSLKSCSNRSIDNKSIDLVKVETVSDSEEGGNEVNSKNGSETKSFHNDVESSNNDGEPNKMTTESQTRNESESMTKHQELTSAQKDDIRPVSELQAPLEAAPPQSVVHAPIIKTIKKHDTDDENTTIFFCCA